MQSYNKNPNMQIFFDFFSLPIIRHPRTSRAYHMHAPPPAYTGGAHRDAPRGARPRTPPTAIFDMNF